MDNGDSQAKGEFAGQTLVELDKLSELVFSEDY
jgi:hypothetical protein